jgi:hypothetical protein
MYTCGVPASLIQTVGHRQQNYLWWMFSKRFSQDVFNDPGELDATMLAVTGVAVDEGT